MYKQSVRHDLGKLAIPEISRILDRIEQELIHKAASNPVLKGKFAGLRKYRIGDYRIIYALKADEIIILRIAHRSEVYRR